jgi:hypothetical protein
LRTPTFQPKLPRDTKSPIETLARVIAAAQDNHELRAGQPALLASIFIGCILRPISVASFAAPGTLNLLAEPAHDQVIEDAAVAALPIPGDEMNLDTLEPVHIGGITQSIRIRGTAASNPPLLLMQQGPGLPIINEAHGYERRLGLEREFTVVYWDQRGTGLSSHTSKFSADRMVDDTVSMLELLRERFDRKARMPGSPSVRRCRPSRRAPPRAHRGLTTTGMDIDIPAAEHHTDNFVLRTARNHGNRHAIRQLEQLGAPPHVEAKPFATRARWATNFGGVTANTPTTPSRASCSPAWALPGLLARRPSPHRPPHPPSTDRTATTGSTITSHPMFMVAARMA